MNDDVCGEKEKKSRFYLDPAIHGQPPLRPRVVHKGEFPPGPRSRCPRCIVLACRSVAILVLALLMKPLPIGPMFHRRFAALVHLMVSFIEHG